MCFVLVIGEKSALVLVCSPFHLFLSYSSANKVMVVRVVKM